MQDSGSSNGENLSDREQVSIRSVTAADREEWLKLWKGYLDFYQASVSDDQTQLTFSRFLDPTESLNCFVAVSGNRPCGFATWQLHRSTWARNYYCYLEDLFVGTYARGKGIGRSLIRAVTDEAVRQGAGKIYWQTHSSNRSARRLYDQVADNQGFIIYSNKLG